jgi:hypothetical protein
MFLGDECQIFVPAQCSANIRAVEATIVSPARAALDRRFDACAYPSVQPDPAYRFKFVSCRPFNLTSITDRCCSAAPREPAAVANSCSTENVTEMAPTTAGHLSAHNAPPIRNPGHMCNLPDARRAGAPRGEPPKQAAPTLGDGSGPSDG